MQTIIDTHIHIWNLQKADYPWLQNDTSLLNQNWRIEQLDAERLKAGVTSGVLVQASGNIEDTALMLETADKTAWIKGVVCWLPLVDTEKTQELLHKKYLNDQYIKGVRHQIHDEQDVKWLLQPSVISSLKVLAKKLFVSILAWVSVHAERWPGCPPPAIWSAT